MPPSIKDLENRLIKRETESTKSLKMRMKKSSEEMSKSDLFDITITNNNLKSSCEEVVKNVKKFILN